MTGGRIAPPLLLANVEKNMAVSANKRSVMTLYSGRDDLF